MIHKHRKYVCVSVYIRAFLLFLLKALLFHIALKHDGKLKGIMVYVKKKSHLIKITKCVLMPIYNIFEINHD